MRASSFNYLVKHGFQSLWLNRLMTIASVASTASMRKYLRV